MSEETLRYDIWVEEALRSVIQKALAHISENGLPGDHHYYISFHTRDAGVSIPPRLLAQHPNDMTIVLQYQYEDLDVGDETFAVTLSFGGIKEHLIIPYASVISFADPSVNFALQLKMSAQDDEENDDFDADDIEHFDAEHLEYFESTRREAGLGGEADAETDAKIGKEKTGEVIALDAFRKK